MSRKKSDHADAMTLANILRTDAHMHRPLPVDTELVRAIAVLARAHQDATWRRTKTGNKLRSLLREYYPGFLDAFAGGNATNLAHADARAVLAITPTPAAAAKLTRARIAAAPRRAGHKRGADDLAARLHEANVFNRLLGCLYHYLRTGQTYSEATAFPTPDARPEPAAA